MTLMEDARPAPIYEKNMERLQDPLPVGHWTQILKDAFRPWPEVPPDVLRRQIAIIYQNSPAGLTVNVLVALALAWWFRSAGPPWYGGLWVLGSLLLCLLRYLDGRFHRTLGLDLDQLARARRNLRLWAAAQGILWGGASTLLAPASPLQQMSLLAILCGLAAGGLLMLAPIWSIYALYSVPALAPLCFRFLASSRPPLALVGVLGLGYGFIMLFIAAHTCRWLEDALLAARENQALLGHLRNANAALADFHTRLETSVAERTQALHTALDRIQEDYAAREEERRRDQEREESLRRTQRLESLGLLAGGIAHDFNNLLGAIQGNLDLLQLQAPADAADRAHLAHIGKAVQRATVLTRQMLAYSGKGQFTLQNVDLNQVVRELTTLLDVCISRRPVLRLELGPDLPPIHGDPAQLQQAVMNLVINASEALGGGDGEIQVATRLQDLDPAGAARVSKVVSTLPGPHVVLEVRDTGRGMEPEVLARIFDPFFTTKEDGRGLGLSALLGILRGHGAGLEILSRPGAGSTFRLYFPASGEPDEAGAAAAPPFPGGFRGHVLVVDDEPVLLDLAMPLLDGRQTCRALHRLRPGLPIILSSGNDPRHAPRDDDAHEGRVFLRKPYTLEELRRVLAAVLSRQG